jgi:acetyl-CoA synthetase
MDQFDFGGAIAWRPSAEYIERSRLTAFMRKHRLDSFDELMTRSTTDLEWFWRAVMDDLGIQFHEPFTRVIDLAPGIARPKWCVGGRMNIVHNCLEKWAGTPTANRHAVRWEGEEGSVRALTYAELLQEVNRAAGGLRALGIGRGDRVALFMPMCPELVAAFFAVIKVGGIVLPLFSGYGADAVITRLQDAGAKALITSDGFWRRGQPVKLKEIADASVAAVPSVEHVIVARRIGADITMRSQDIWWTDLVAGQSDSSATENTGADEPMMIIYTSGTTGRPKGAVHSHCGFPIKTAQDMVHCFDVQDGDTMYWVSDMGWMMGPWEVIGMTLLGGTMVLYDGALDFPAPDRLWSLVERHRVNVLGVSPTLIRALMRHGEAPVRAHDLSSLRILGSTGEPWNPEPWKWFFDVVGRGRLPIINYSGGTEVSGGLVGGNVLTPLKPAAFAGPPPGIAADVVDDQGRPVRNQVGELIVRTPWIGMTRGFWNDDERYVQAYWSRFPDVWVHGDWAAIDDDGLWYILGRSDDTIKVAGKRLGPAEVESVLVDDPAVLEAAAIGVPDEMKGRRSSASAC